MTRPLSQYGERIISVFELPYTEAGQQVNVTCSAGIASFPDDAPDMDALVSNADTAMYRAKELGKNRCVRFDASMNQAMVRRQAIEQSAARRAGRRPRPGAALPAAV